MKAYKVIHKRFKNAYRRNMAVVNIKTIVKYVESDKACY